jgi:hypothetical protein
VYNPRPAGLLNAHALPVIRKDKMDGAKSYNNHALEVNDGQNLISNVTRTPSNGIHNTIRSVKANGTYPTPLKLKKDYLYPQYGA